MTINRQIITAITLSTILFSCGQQQPTTFNDETLLENYSLKIPTDLHKVSEGSWATPSSSRELLLLEIHTTIKDEKSLQEHLDAIVNEDTREVHQGKSLVGTETLSFNGFNGIAEYYSKDNSNGGFPVMSHYAFAVLQNGTEVLKINSVSLGKNCTEDIKTTIKSIKTISQDFSKTSAVSTPKIDLNKSREEGYQIFEKDNFIIKCNCPLEKNTVAVQMAKEQGITYPISSYVCAENEDSYETGAICNVQITDIESDYDGLSKNQENQFTDEYLQSYISNLVANNMSYTEGELDGVKTVEYSFVQMEMPAKALIFVKERKSYMLQISTRTNLSEKFNDLKASFQFIN